MIKEIARSKDSSLCLDVRRSQSGPGTYFQPIKLHFDRRGQLVRIDKIIDVPDSLLRIYVKDRQLVGVFAMTPEEMIMWGGSFVHTRNSGEHSPFILAAVDAFGLIYFGASEKFRCGLQD